jgi:hypothetical protein
MKAYKIATKRTFFLNKYENYVNLIGGRTNYVRRLNGNINLLIFISKTAMLVLVMLTLP